MKLKIDKRWKFISLYELGWSLHEKEPLFVHNYGWAEIKDRSGDSEGQLYIVDYLPEFDDEPKLFKRKGDEWIEVPRNKWEEVPEDQWEYEKA